MIFLFPVTLATFQYQQTLRGTLSVNISDVLCLKFLARKASFFSHSIVLTLLKKNRKTCEHLKLLPLETF